jgi:DDE superfamily endonuclease
MIVSLSSCYSSFLFLGGIVAASESGFINTELFIVWLQFFIDVVKPTQQKPVVLVLDGHTSHTKCIEALDMARANGVILIQLPAHCTHRMQPLDVGFFYPLGKAYATEVTKWQNSNPGIPFTTRQFCGVFSKAYEAKANIEVARKAFETSGIWPVNREVFSSTDFARIAYNTESLETDLVEACGSKSAEYGRDWSNINVSSCLDDGSQLVPPKKLAPTCTVTSEPVDAAVSGTNFDQNFDTGSSNDSSDRYDGRQHEQLKNTAPSSTTTSDQATAAACGVNIIQNLRVIATFCDSSGLSDARQLVQPKQLASSCTLTSDQATAAACGLSIAQNLRVLQTFYGLSGSPLLQKHKEPAPTCTITSKQAAAATCGLTSTQNLGDSATVHDVNGSDGSRQVIRPHTSTTTTTSDQKAAMTRNLDTKPRLLVPLSEIMPIPTIRVKTNKAATAPVIELTSQIYISGLKEKNRIKEEKAKAKLEAQEARVLAKKAREDKKIEEKKANEEKKRNKLLIKEEKRLEAEKMKAERQRKKAEKTSKKRSQDDDFPGAKVPKIEKK